MNIQKNVVGTWLTKHLLNADVRPGGTYFPELRYLEVNVFEEDSGVDFDEALWQFANSGQPVIPLVVDSYGGQVYTLLRFLDTIKAVQDAGHIVMTIGKSKCMSCGSVLVAAGTKGYRFIQPTATIMVHEVASGIWSSKNEEVQASAEETERLNTLLLEKLSVLSGKKKGFFKREIHRKGHADWFLSAKESVELGLVDRIGEPRVRLDLRLDVNIDLK